MKRKGHEQLKTRSLVEGFSRELYRMWRQTLPAQETKQRIKIAQMNRTIRQMQNEITILRRNKNYIPNPRMMVP
jgi:hypothetical protein